MNKPREIILRLVADGKITVEEADELLDAIERGKEDFFTDFFGKEQASRAKQEAAKARAKMYYDAHRPGAEGRARQEATRARARTGRSGRRSTGERGPQFNFPWQEADWQWPWNNPDWQWPWESPDWKWPWDKAEGPGPKPTLEVPEEAQLKIRADGGDLRIRGTDGELLKFANPRAASLIGTEDKVIQISVQGNDLGIEVPAKILSMEIALRDGNLKVQDLKSELAANVAGGDMDISRATGNIQASVDGGEDIRLADIESREVEVRTDSGDIYLNMLPVVEESSIVLSSESGDISLFLPPDSRCQISASAPGGEISHNLPPERVGADESEKSLSAKLNDGGADIVLSTETGDISIKV